MGLGAHLVETIRHLHAVGGPLLAFLGAMPALTRRNRSRVAEDHVVKNVHFATDLPPAKSLQTDPARILAGDPAQTASDLFVSPDKRFTVGLWTGQPGTWRIDFAAHEFISILEGVVVVTDAAGVSRTYRAGDAFVTPAGFSGTWEVIEPVTKHFVLYFE